MPTRRGWGVLGLAMGLLLLWLLLGESEFLSVGALLAAAMALAFAWVRIADPSVPITRDVQPERVREGDDVVITLELTNPSPVPLLGITLVDSIRGVGSSTSHLARVPAHKRVRVPYRLTPRSRGVYRVGPVQVSVTDPLGLMIRSAVGGPVDTLIVYPRTEVLEGYPVVRGRDPSIQASRPEFSARGGEDFFTIREYRHGDDLRRVHWPTTARRDELMIRQFETPWQSRGLLILDTRAGVHDPDGFESAVRGAASAYLHLERAGFELDALIGSDHIRSQDPDPTNRVLEALAAVQPNTGLDLRAVVARLRRRFIGGALVVVTGEVDEQLGQGVSTLGPDFGTVLLLSASTVPIGLLPSIRTPMAAATCLPGETWAGTWQRLKGRAWQSV
ncbi:MAG: DUF58 domain-containing protein [Acidimicrobiia bacterium]|nr:DUF58 domain-containing protein [Acidimicrobiia bacterium]